MDRDFQRGYLELQAPAMPFTSPFAVLGQALRLFGSRFGLIASVTLLVYLPGHLLYQFLATTFDIPSNGVLSIVLLEVLDMVLASLVTPAIVHGLLRNSGTGTALRWGRRQWMATLGAQVLVEVTVVLYGLLIIVPGLIAMLRLAFVPVIVAVEADQQARPLDRSRALAKGRLWKILAVLLPLALVDLAANFLLLDKLGGVDQARLLFAVAESGLAIVTQLTTVATLVMYLGVVEPSQKKTAKL